MFTITKQFTFSAAHQLQGLPADHQCSREHGHNYRVEFVLESEELNAVGFVRDYNDLDDVKAFIEQFLEHRNLNKVVAFNPTAENLARAFFWTFQERYPELVAVRVSETEKTWCEYRPQYRPTGLALGNRAGQRVPIAVLELCFGW